MRYSYKIGAVMIWVLTACTSPPDAGIHLEKTQSQKTMAVNKVSPPVAPPDAPAGDSSCRKALQLLSLTDLPSVLPNDQLVVELAATTVYTEQSLIAWAEKAAMTLQTASTCPFKSVAFLATGANDAVLQGAFLFSDYDLLAHKKISNAEWVRRLDIKSVTTMAAIKKKIVALRQKGERATALELIATWLEQEPENISAKLIKANILIEQQESFAALTVLDEVLLAEPQNLLALYNKAFVKKSLGTFSEAIQIYHKILPLLNTASGKEAPFTRDQVLLHLAEACLGNNQIPETSEVLAEVRHQESSEWIILQANLLRLKGKVLDAQLLLNKLAASSDASPIVYYNLVLLALDQKDLPAAERSLKKLRGMSPAMAKELDFLEPFQQGNTGTKTSTQIPNTNTNVDSDEDEDEED